MCYAPKFELLLSFDVYSLYMFLNLFLSHQSMSDQRGECFTHCSARHEEKKTKGGMGQKQMLVTVWGQ